MIAVAIIIIILLVLNLFFDMVYVYFKSKYIKIMEKQNKLLWETVEQSKALMAESLRELQKTQDQLHETKEDIQ